MKTFLRASVLIITTVFLFAMTARVTAQDGCYTDPATGKVICPGGDGGQRRTPQPATATFTPTATQIPTNTATPTATFTPTNTPTATPLPGAAAGSARETEINWLPGIGIGALILTLIVTVFLPAVQKARVKKRGY